jgi:hypothetical protein
VLGCGVGDGEGTRRMRRAWSRAWTLKRLGRGACRSPRFMRPADSFQADSGRTRAGA